MTHDKVHLLEKFARRYPLNYPVLSDRGARMVNAFRVRNKSARRGTPQYGIPHPGVVLIDASGVIRAKAAIRGYVERPRFEDIYAMAVATLDLKLAPGLSGSEHP